MPNLYADLADWQNRFHAGKPVTPAQGAMLLRVLEAASRDVDGYCNRPRFGFFATEAALVLDGTGKDPTNTDYLQWATRSLFTQAMSELSIPDCLAATEVALDQDTDGTFETVLSPGSDYYLIQEGADDQDAPPWNRLQLNTFTGRVTVFTSRPRLTRITGTWGYTQETEMVAVTGTLADATSMTLTTSGPGDLAAGQTLRLGAEQVFVESGADTTWTVRRAQNGTTGAAHATVPMLRYVYVPAAREAVLRLAAHYERTYGEAELVPVEAERATLRLRKAAEEGEYILRAYGLLDRYKRYFV